MPSNVEFMSRMADRWWREAKRDPNCCCALGLCLYVLPFRPEGEQRRGCDGRAGRRGACCRLGRRKLRVARQEALAKESRTAAGSWGIKQGVEESQRAVLVPNRSFFSGGGGGGVRRMKSLFWCHSVAALFRVRSGKTVEHVFWCLVCGPTLTNERVVAGKELAYPPPPARESLALPAPPAGSSTERTAVRIDENVLEFHRRLCGGIAVGGLSGVSK